MPSTSLPRPLVPTQARPNLRSGSKLTPSAKATAAGHEKVTQAPLNRRSGSKYTPTAAVIAAGRKRIPSQAPGSANFHKTK